MTAPWNAYQWVNCTGSVMMQTLYPSTDESDSQRDGKACHYIIEKMLMAWKTGDACPTMSQLIGMESPNGVIVDEDMAQAAIDYVTDIMKYCNETSSLRLISIEEDLDLSHLGDNMDDGRPDVYIWNPTLGEIFVSDFKYGHRITDVYENYQLLCYVSGIIEKFEINDANVRMRVFQPRAPHPDGPSREWQSKASEIRGYVNQIKHASHQAYSEQSQCKSGDWCSTCTGRHNCETFTRNVYAAMDYVNEPVPFELSNAGLSAEYLLLKRCEELIKVRKSAVEQQCVSKMQHGDQLPGLAVQQGYGREKWQGNVDLDEVVLMADLLGVDINKPREIDTPAQVRKKGIDPEVISKYSYTPKTRLKIIKDDGSKARQVFRKQ